MPHDPNRVAIYHITPIANLPQILSAGALLSDAALAGTTPHVIGYNHIKLRRLREYKVGCCGDRFVGEFVPFYFCPRSPMLYTINRGNTGQPPGCQKDIVHLVSTVAHGLAMGRAWAIADGNAGAAHAAFYDDIHKLDALDWTAIRATDWQRRTHQKMAEFLVADLFEWSAITAIGCHNSRACREVEALIAAQPHRPTVEVKPGWYY